MEKTAPTILLQHAYRYSLEYLESIDARPVFPKKKDLDALDLFNEPFPKQGTPGLDVVSMLHHYGSNATTAQTGGRYFGFVNGGMLPVGLAAKWLSGTWDQNAALYLMSPIVSHLEQLCEKWLVELFRLPKATAMGLVTGTSTALICGLAAGRNEIYRRLGWDVVGDGLVGAPLIKVVISEHAHGTVLKALSLLGLGTKNAIRVPCDDQGRMRVDDIPELDHRTLLVVSAGEVNSGAFDDLSAICALAKDKGAWVHVDGAFGLWAAASKRRCHLYEGAQHADSWSVDAHKTLNAPYDCGIVLCRDRNALTNALQASGSYIQWSEHRDGMLYTTEMSKRARGVELWAVLKSLGYAGIGQLVDQLCDLARLFAVQLEEAGFSILNDVVFNQVLIACDSDEETIQTLGYLQKSGECWCSGTIWKQRNAIRISVCNWSTTESDIHRSVLAFVNSRTQAVESNQSPNHISNQSSSESGQI